MAAASASHLRIPHLPRLAICSQPSSSQQRSAATSPKKSRGGGCLVCSLLVKYRGYRREWLHLQYPPLPPPPPPPMLGGAQSYTQIVWGWFQNRPHPWPLEADYRPVVASFPVLPRTRFTFVDNCGGEHFETGSETSREVDLVLYI